MARDSWKIGELARQTGISVRTLHHYDAIGLLSPSARGDNNYRLYNRDDIVRLGQIKSLRQIEFSLEEIGACLSRADFSAACVIEMHLSRLKEQMARQHELQARLERIAAQLQSQREVSTAEFLKMIEGISMTEKYYTPEQMTYLEERRNIVGEARIREVEAEWPRLMDEVRQAIARGDAPSSEVGQALAQRWNALVNEFTGGDAGVRQSLNSVYENESNVGGMDVEGMRDLFDFITRANQAASR